ncbi:MAG: hypothetical protein U1F57_10645 [bacterium]
MIRKIHSILSILGFALTLVACSGGSDQVSGIMAEAQFLTSSCQPKSKTINIRNDNTAEPQRVQGVYFEGGTNQFGQGNSAYYKIENVTVNGNQFASTDGSVQEVIIPAGGVMAVKVTYKPKDLTAGSQRHTSYLDVFLNGPKLGIMQVKLSGESDGPTDGCGGPAGDVKKFSVTKADFDLNFADAPINGDFKRENLQVTGDFQFTVDGSKAIMTKADFPKITLPLPNGVAPISSADITLADDTFEGTFDGTKLSFDNLTLVMAGIINVPGVKLKAEALDVSGPKGHLSLTGSALSGGKMTVVIGVAIPSGIANLDSIAGGAVGLTLELQQK